MLPRVTSLDFLLTSVEELHRKLIVTARKLAEVLTQVTYLRIVNDPHGFCTVLLRPVSYTHLDVYKRQTLIRFLC